MREVSIADLKETIRCRAQKLELLLERYKESHEGINEALKQMWTLSHLTIIIVENCKVKTIKERNNQSTI